MKLPQLTVRNLVAGVIGLLIAAVAMIMAIYVYMYLHLPDVNTLKNIQLQVPLRIYTLDSKLIAQYGEKRRTPVTLEQVPQPLIHAILATEDQRYYNHPGVDFIGLVRATVAVVTSGRKSQGASTITMQVARNFFLTRKKTFSRKLNEILLAIKIDATFSKTKILELYLNKIYLGHRAYGVGAAADVYYGKSLQDLTLAQLAMIAGLPQAPSRDNPISNPEAAKERRNHVLARMLENGHITQTQYDEAVSQPVTARYHHRKIEVYAPYIAEMVRAAMVDVYGENAYTGGYQVFTTVDSKLQIAANTHMQKGLEAYDVRHGYRGPEDNWGTPNQELLEEWQLRLEDMKPIHQMLPAAVVEVNADQAQALLADGAIVNVPMAGMAWARQSIKHQFLGPKPVTPSDVVKVGDVIRLKKVGENWQLAQIPDIEGALTALSPYDGAVKALVGGYNYEKSNYNRATQAKRQSGSAFKPFIYSAALAKGFTLASVINDAPVVMEESGVDPLWRPSNSSKRFYGPTRLRTALVKSRNLVTIRLLRSIGIDYAVNYMRRFGFNDEALPQTMSLALGSGLLTPMQLTSAYAILANGGFKVKPYFIDTIRHDNGEIIYQEHPLSATENNTLLEDEFLEETKDDTMLPAERVITPQNAYLITSALQDVIQFGTGRGARVLHRKDISGKTGTTNKQVDAWFAGYTKDIVTTVWVGFDQPQSMQEYAAKAALPIWVDFMRDALKDHKPQKLEQPANIVNVKIDPATGLLASPGQKNAMFEIFRQKYAPTTQADQHHVENTATDSDEESDFEELY